MEVMAQCYIIAFSRTLGSQKGFGFQTHWWCVGESLAGPLQLSLTWGCQCLVRLSLLWCLGESKKNNTMLILHKKMMGVMV